MTSSDSVSAPTPDRAVDPRPDSGSSRGGTVSVILPAFHGASELERSLRSVQAQSYPRLDVLVIDDGSHDATAETAERLLGSGPVPGRVLRHEQNWGLSRTLNHGLRETTGDAVLILHQDISLASPEWVASALRDLERSPTVAVVTGYYGLPAVNEVNFAQRVFGVMRRQFHAAPDEGVESVTFSEFKCDLVRRSSLESVGGFPERFRIAGEDLWVSCALRAGGAEILKDYSLRCVQRFTGQAVSVGGNLRKELTFGRAIAGTLIRFRGALARGLQKTPYSRSRSWNRASQPFVVLALLVEPVLWLFTRNTLFWVVLAAILGARLAYYGIRLYPGIRQILGRTGRSLVESLEGAPLGIATDFAYTAGLGLGILNWAFGRKL